MNPYTAVPEALRETRRTLRDILTDMAATKSDEFKLQLGLAKQKGELELAGMRNKSRLAEITADREFQENQLTETTRHHKAIENISAPQAGMLNKTDTLHNWIMSSPLISSGIKGIATKNLPAEELGQVVSGHQAKQLFDMISKNPGFYYRNLKGLVIDKLDDVAGRIQSPESDIDDAGRQKLFDEEYTPIFKQLEYLDAILSDGDTITPKQEEKILEMAANYIKASGGSVNLKDAIAEAMAAVKQIRSEVHGKKWFPSSLKQLLTGPVDSSGKDDKGSWKPYLNKPPGANVNPSPKSAESQNQTLRKIMQDPSSFMNLGP